MPVSSVEPLQWPSLRGPGGFCVPATGYLRCRRSHADEHLRAPPCSPVPRFLAGSPAYRIDPSHRGRRWDPADHRRGDRAHLANTPWSHAYAALRDFQLGPTGLQSNLSLETWAADGLLAVFFFVVGAHLVAGAPVRKDSNDRSSAGVPVDPMTPGAAGIRCQSLSSGGELPC
ncbi:Na+/H+ antiporter NhaA [Nocardia rhamnosiphila]|uniref:Na+/H+ antiporter NhaA n=1 Tax=Nocardia rhamnosiphila TaxID=426716 RepID=UPI003CD0D356